MRGAAGERLQRDRRAGEYGDWNGVEDVLPTPPIWDLGEVVATHQPAEMGVRKAPAKPLQRIGRIGGAESGFDPADPDAAVGGGERSGLLQALGEGRHASNRLQRVLRRDQPPHLVEVETLQRLAADMQVAAMRGIERTAEQPDAASGDCRIETPSPPIRERGFMQERGLPQGRTWPLPRTRYL